MDTLIPLFRKSFPGGSTGKEFACQLGDARDTGSIPGLGRSPGGGNDNALQYSCLENSMDRDGQRSLVGYSPWGCNELDTPEQMSAVALFCNPKINAHRLKFI